MTPKQTGTAVFIAAFGMMATLLSVEIKDLMTWQDMTHPAFIGMALGHLGSVIAAYFGGKITPEDRIGKNTRASDR